jgi:hypothetical protein
MNGAATASEISLLLLRVGWEARGSGFFDYRANDHFARCKLKGQSALFYRVSKEGVCSEFRRVRYRNPEALRLAEQVAEIMSTPEAA